MAKRNTAKKTAPPATKPVEPDELVDASEADTTPGPDDQVTVDPETTQEDQVSSQPDSPPEPEDEQRPVSPSFPDAESADDGASEPQESAGLLPRVSGPALVRSKPLLQFREKLDPDSPRDPVDVVHEGIRLAEKEAKGANLQVFSVHREQDPEAIVVEFAGDAARRLRKRMMRLDGRFSVVGPKPVKPCQDADTSSDDADEDED